LKIITGKSNFKHTTVWWGRSRRESDSEIPNLYLLNPDFLKMNVSSRSPGKILMYNFEIPTIIMLVTEIPDLKMVDPGFPKRPFSSQYT
jgi:hypothetical protein